MPRALIIGKARPAHSLNGERLAILSLGIPARPLRFTVPIIKSENATQQEPTVHWLKTAATSLAPKGPASPHSPRRHYRHSEYKLTQTDASLTFILPAGTSITHNGYLIVARDSSKSQSKQLTALR